MMLRRAISSTFFLLSLTLGSAAVSGCATHYIPNTDVEDTEQNREVISFCEQYRKAVERKDIAKLLEMLDPSYFEDGGNVDASDDLDRAGVEKYLKTRFKDAKAIRYEIRYRRVTYDEDLQRYYVDYTYSASFRIPGPDGKDQWKRVVADNRLELRRDKDGFKILAGM